jgi:ADP-heptose:LPS heptosyltransferase
LVNRTSRYLNPAADYSILNQYATTHPILFAGTLDEYAVFCLSVPSAKYAKVNDFMELTNLIANAKLFIGNQSMCYAIAEQLKTPRLLEVCLFAPNVIPTGANGYDWCHQEHFQVLLQQLLAL